MSSTKVKTSPERSQPKQYQDCICGLTLKLGLSSWWNGQRPQKSLLRLVRRTCSETTLIRSSLALTSAKASSAGGWGIPLYCPTLQPQPNRTEARREAPPGPAASVGTSPLRRGSLGLLGRRRVPDSRLRGGQAGDRDPERAARHVVQA